jgi:hypothetical protein
MLGFNTLSYDGLVRSTIVEQAGEIQPAHHVLHTWHGHHSLLESVRMFDKKFLGTACTMFKITRF